MACAALALLLPAIGCGSGHSTVTGGGARAPVVTGQARTGPTESTPRSSKGASSAGAKATDESSSGSQTGENSVQEFGGEAGGAERTMITAAMRSYFTALADRNYRLACASLAVAVQRSLERIAARQLRSAGCPAILPKLLSGRAADVAREAAGGRVSSVRVKEDRAFLLYHAPGARLYVLTMIREGSTWKAAMIGGSVVIPSLDRSAGG